MDTVSINSSISVNSHDAVSVRKDISAERAKERQEEAIRAEGRDEVSKAKQAAASEFHGLGTIVDVFA